jgi:hypothetical protein
MKKIILPIILVSAFQNANAIKLCAKTNPEALSYAINPNPGAWTWAVGLNCADKWSENASELCQTLRYHGYAICNQDAVGDGKNGPKCFCVKLVNGNTWSRYAQLKTFASYEDCISGNACKKECAEAVAFSQQTGSWL